MTSIQQNGFTLLEVMLAVMIFSVAVLGLLMALNKTMEATADANKESQVMLALQTRLAEAREIDFAPGSTNDGPDEYGINYTKLIEPLELQNKNGRQLNNLYRVQITATWGQAGPDETETAEEYVYH